MNIVANGIKTAQTIIYALLRSLTRNPCKSIALAVYEKKLLSDVPSDESVGEELTFIERFKSSFQRSSIV